MTEGERCLECGKELAGDGSERICPDCLLQDGPNRNGTRLFAAEGTPRDSLPAPPGQPSAPPIAFPKRWQGVRRRLRGPGIGLLATGLISVTLGVTVHFFAWPGSNRWFIALGTMGLASGPVIMWGAFCLMRLEWLWLVRLSSWLAVLPCGFGWLLGLPVGIWTLRILVHPEVQAAFRLRQAEYDAEQDRILDEADADLRDP